MRELLMALSNRTHFRWYKNIYKLRYPFEGSEDITFSYSQIMQDIMILTLTNGKKNGTYLEIGCNVPDYTNNTYLMSQKYNWSGLSIDYLMKFTYDWRTLRPNDNFLCCDALTVDYEEIMHKQYRENYVIDYLQLDVDPSENTLKTLKRLPMTKYRFGIITYETDVYLGNQKIQNESRQILNDLGYTMLVGDMIAAQYGPCEDWWVDMSLINQEIAIDIKERNLNLPRDIFLT